MSRRDLATEQTILRAFKRLPKPPRRLLLAISGGVDSIVMAEILWKWRRGLRLELAVAYVHHGRTDDRPQRLYRKQAQCFVAEWAERREIPFFTNMSGRKLKTEAEFRTFRHAQLEAWRERGNYDAIAFAHHQDDLLETRMLRLIRGSGTQGLRAMAFFGAYKLRPLLGTSEREIRAYALSRDLEWVEDPSNADAALMRNWLRRKWLPLLEKQRPGAVTALARSLESLAPGVSQASDLGPYVGLRREAFFGVSSQQQRALLAQYLRSLGLKNYAQTHVDEILKRLGTGRKNFTFAMLGMHFHISPDFLWASRV